MAAPAQNPRVLATGSVMAGARISSQQRSAACQHLRGHGFERPTLLLRSTLTDALRCGLHRCRWSDSLRRSRVRCFFFDSNTVAVTADTKCAAMLRGDAGGANSAGWSSGRGEHREDVGCRAGHVRASAVARADTIPLHLQDVCFWCCTAALNKRRRHDCAAPPLRSGRRAARALSGGGRNLKVTSSAFSVRSTVLCCPTQIAVDELLEVSVLYLQVVGSVHCQWKVQV